MEFKEQLKQEKQIGTFMKTPHPHIVEILSLSGLDFVIFDAEHCPFDRATLDLCIMTARLTALPSLVRIQNSLPSTILNALDCGANGIVVPHVCTAEQAKNIVKNSHYGEGGRGYAGSSRTAEYTCKTMASHLKDSANKTTVIVQIEDPEGVTNVDGIAEIDGVDALFIGQVDLAVAYNVDSVNDERVFDASLKIIDAAKKSAKPVGMFIADASLIPKWSALGVTFFGLASEQKMIIDGFKNQRMQVTE